MSFLERHNIFNWIIITIKQSRYLGATYKYGPGTSNRLFLIPLSVSLEFPSHQFLLKFI